MVSLDMLNNGQIAQIKSINGQDETKQFLEKLGFISGDMIQVVSKMCGNVIVNVKESRIAISKEMAQRIILM